MRFHHRSPSHWIAVVVVLVLGLFTFRQAGGQAPGAGSGIDRHAEPPQALRPAR